MAIHVPSIKYERYPVEKFLDLVGKNLLKLKIASLRKN